ncbi:lipocalin family protein [Bacteroides intestinalis]|jgi:hypothetical protein|uniref:lipocalin family protein n=1 Tax=Bacteroides intestinalis TaxID=329854 RepID=UPI0018A00023|nr:lipocalin family protein [Bacteroides intestinalis]
MRTFKFLAALIMAVVCVSFSSCSKDDDENLPKIEQANLIGKWQSTWEKIHKVENGKEVVTSDEAYTNGFLEFKADGTCIESSTNSDYKETSRWSLKDNKLTLSHSDGYSDVVTVNELTANKLVLAFEDWDNTEDGGLELDDVTTTAYKKMK